MSTNLIQSGGIQVLASIQYVYLDFDGEITSYNGELLAIDNVVLTDSNLTKEEIHDIVSALNARYSDSNVIFVTERPIGIEFSTVYVGYTSSFEPYGNFAGLAETIDHGNQIANDNAFVILNGSESIEQIADTIAHEVDHIVFGFEHGGEALNRYAATYYVSNGTVSTGIILNDDYMLVGSAGTVSNTTVGFKGTLHIGSGGVASRTTLLTGGEVGLWAPGYGGFTNIGTNSVFIEKIVDGYVVCTINNLSFSGRLLLGNGGITNHITVNGGGHLFVFSGGVANNTIVYYDMTVLNGGRAYDSIVSSGYRMHVDSGGIANNTTVQVGALSINSGGVANQTIVNGGVYPDGNLYVNSNGVANYTTVNSGGHMYVSAGGVANDIQLSPGGRTGAVSVYVFTNVGENTVFIKKITDGNIVSTIDDLSFKGYLYLGNNGVANRTIMNYLSFMYISAGAKANDTTLNEGQLYISSGGLATGTIINPGGQLYVLNGGVLKNTIVNYRGYLNVSSGGKLGGVLSLGGFFETRGSVDLQQGTVIFAVDQRNTYDDAIIDRISNLWNVGEYSITVKDDQAIGQYKLANYATEFNQNITIGNGTLNYGTLTVNGTAVNGWGRDYSLTVSNGYLLLNVANGATITHKTPVVTLGTTNWTNQDILVSVAFNSQTLKTEYSLDGGKTWSVYNKSFTVSANIQLHFRTTYANGSVYTDQYSISNIDKASPTVTQITSNTTEPTNQNVTVTANFNDNVGVTYKQYRIDNGSWINYISGVTMTVNGTIYFRALDAAGNEATAQYTVSNIDKNPPLITINIDNTKQTTLNLVYVSAAFSDDVGVQKQEYSFDATSWFVYSSAVEMKNNGTVYFRAQDTAGNITQNKYIVSSFPSDEPKITGTVTTVSKYNVTFTWDRYVIENATTLCYQVMVDGAIQGTLTNTKYTLKNASVGNHSFSVRAILSQWNGESVYSAWSSNITESVTDITAPKTGKLTLEQTGEDTVKLNWIAATDNVGIARYEVTCNGESRSLAANVLSTEFSGKAGKVTASIVAYDAAGLAGKIVKKTLTIKDVTRPTQVSGLRSEGVNNKSGGVLVWNPATDNVGVTQYIIAIEGGKTYKSKTNTVKIKKMAAGTYNYTVIALDKAKNQSITSLAGEFTVADVIDPKIKKLACKVTDQSAAVTWNATDEVGIVRSELWLDNQRFDTTGLTSWNLSGLELGNHSLKLNVWDAASNMASKMVNCNIKTLNPNTNTNGMLAVL